MIQNGFVVTTTVDRDTCMDRLMQLYDGTLLNEKKAKNYTLQIIVFFKDRDAAEAFDRDMKNEMDDVRKYYDV